MKLKIVLDDNIPHAQEIFESFGNLVSLPGRKIKNEDLKNANALIIRSVTNVDGNLLQNTAIKFVGTCTIGTDHVKEKELQEADVHFCSAPGCNAQSVAEYVLCSLLDFAHKTNTNLKGKTIGIVGVGNVGTLVAKYAEQLEMKVFLNDPPRQRNGDALNFVPFAEILSCDFITLHVPLYKQGTDKTHYLINSDILSKMKSSAVIINTCRGSVVNNNDLKLALQNKIIHGAILDVWENEPNIDKELFDLCFIGTPHIAGYSYDAKIRGSTMIAEKLSNFFHIPMPNYGQIGKPEISSFALPKLQGDDEKCLKLLCNLFYDPRDDHLSLKEALTSVNSGENFDNLRKKYRKRREFQVVSLEYQKEVFSDKFSNKLKNLQFKKL